MILAEKALLLSRQKLGECNVDSVRRQISGCCCHPPGLYGSYHAACLNARSLFSTLSQSLFHSTKNQMKMSIQKSGQLALTRALKHTQHHILHDNLHIQRLRQHINSHDDAAVSRLKYQHPNNFLPYSSRYMLLLLQQYKSLLS